MHPLDYRTAADPSSELRWGGIHGLAAAVAVAPAAAMAAIVVTHCPDNHVDGDLRLAVIVPAVVALSYSLAGVCRWGRSRVVRTVAVIAGLATLACLVADHFNLVDDYDLWIGRGMPDPWQFSW